MLVSGQRTEQGSRHDGRELSHSHTSAAAQGAVVATATDPCNQVRTVYPAQSQNKANVDNNPEPGLGKDFI